DLALTATALAVETTSRSVFARALRLRAEAVLDFSSEARDLVGISRLGRGLHLDASVDGLRLERGVPIELAVEAELTVGRVQPGIVCGCELDFELAIHGGGLDIPGGPLHVDPAVDGREPQVRGPTRAAELDLAAHGPQFHVSAG